MAISKLSPDRLYRQCEPGQFGFQSTAELEVLDEIIGQPRAIDSMHFGMGIHHKGYNLFALGPVGTGKHNLVLRYARAQALNEPQPPDWCYVYNFQRPHEPRALQLPPGRGRQLEQDMDQLVADLHAAIPTIFESEEYRTRSQAIEEELGERKDQALQEIQQAAEQKQIALVRTPTGFTLAPVRKDETLSLEEFEKLPEAERTRIEQDTAVLQERLRRLLHEFPKWDKETRDRMNVLNREMATSAISHLTDALRNAWQDQERVTRHIDEIEDDVIANFRYFLRHDEEKPPLHLFGMELPQRDDGQVDRRYRINAFITHDDAAAAPVVYEDYPSYDNLTGRVEYQAELGALITDFTRIRPGALHRANGGYLVLDALKVLMQPFAWEGLKRALQANEIRIEPLAQLMSLVSTVSLKPEPVPLQVKVILVGEPHLYYLLSLNDPEFSELFKVPVDFDYRMERTAGTEQLYARLIGTLVRKESLRHLDCDAVARVVEHSARMLGDSEKLLTHIRSLTDVLRESDYQAAQNRHDTITGTDVQQAIDARIYRVDRIREQMLDEIRRGTVLIDTDGEKTGQVNGLSVIDIGSFVFARPTRITARARMGDRNVIDIEREVELGGPIHSKGVYILSALLGARYSLDRPLTLSASLVFEQSYGEIEGDSASSAEYYALLSALSGLPVKQSLAVTGSVNQQGEIQPIGGVNEKIEGFFDLCNLRGLTGDQGVIIPASNVQHLMLREEVRTAVAAGRFTIYAVETVDDGIELLTGVAAGERNAEGWFPEGSVNRLVEEMLMTFADLMQAFAARRDLAPPAEPSSS